MKVKLTDVPVYYVNLEGDDEKRKHTESMLKNLGFKYVERFDAIRHEAGRIIGCARSHHEILSKDIEPPFIILEDDCALAKDFVDEVELPDNADALYLGISHWGRYLNHSGPYVHYSECNDDIVRVYNMLATHAIMYTSKSYIDICKRISYTFGYEIENHLDIGFAEVHRFYNVFSFNEPLFRQYDWNQVTTGKLSENAFNKNSGDSLFNKVNGDDENFYKLNETFKSPLRPLLQIRDVSGVPGYFYPTKLL